MTLDQVNALTPEERNRKIAEICGWTNLFEDWSGHGGSVLTTKGNHPVLKDDGPFPIPNYGSLDACAEMVTVMSYEQADAFDDELYDIVEHDWQSLDTRPPLRFAVCNATSEQRSKAFLMVMLP